MVTIEVFPMREMMRLIQHHSSQMTLFTQAISQCHIPLYLIHELGFSHWHHLSPSIQATGLS